MTTDRLISLLITVTLIEMMVTIGLGVTYPDLVRVARDWRLIGRAFLANYVVVPAATAVLLLLFRAPPLVAAGFLILAVCPGAPFIPPLVSLARGDTAAAVGLMAVLAASSAVIAPLLLALLLPLLAGDEPLPIDAGRIALTLLGTQLLPLAFGLAVRWRHERFAERLLGPAAALSKLLNVASVGAILATQYPSLAEVRVRGWVGMTVLLLITWAAGWLFGGPGAEARKTMTLTAGLRNVGVGLVIATAGFPGTPAVTAVLAFGLMGVFGSLLLARVWAREPRPV